MEEINIRYYNEDDSARWDEFVMNNSSNGTFLQTKRFLGYHPEGRFEDCSLIVENKKGQLLAVCPACISYEQGKKVFFSHKGSTYGGIVLSKKITRAGKVIDIVKAVEEFIKNDGFDEIVFKNTPDVFCVSDDRILEYVMYFLNYSEEKELSLVVDYEQYKDVILSNFAQDKRTDVNNAVKAGLTYRSIGSYEEIVKFHELLTKSLLKYNVKPVHTVDELMLLKDSVLKEECGFYGVFNGDDMIAGSMMFYFKQSGVAHAQYLAASADCEPIEPAVYLYYAMLEEMKRLGFKKLSWGTSTENGGKELNYGLTFSKESYGSKHTINRIFKKNLEKK